MAIEKITVRRCDVCASDDGVAQYRIIRLVTDRKTLTVDLCTEHSQMIEGLFSRLGRKARSRAEIGAEKAAAKKAAPRKKS